MLFCQSLLRFQAVYKVHSEKQKNYSTIYEPNHIIKAGIGVWAEMFRELIAHSELIWRLIVRDIAARYKQSVLGILWAFLKPLATLMVFVWIKKKNILPIGDTNIPYPAFVFLGQIIWLFFSFGVTTAASSLVVAGQMVKKINFPREVLVLSSVGQTIFEFLIRIPLLALVFLWVGFTPEWTILFVPFVMIPLLLMIIGSGFFLSILNAIIRDISGILGIVMSLGMFVTPIIYPPPTTWPFSFWINYVNPVSGFVTAVRDLTTLGYLTNPVTYLSSTLFSILVFFVAWRAFHIAEPKIAERI